jgi:integrase
VLCGFRTGLRAGELLALQWGDINWRAGFLQVQRNLVRGQTHDAEKSSGPACGRVAAIARGAPALAWVFPSDAGTPLDESNVRKAFNRILDAAELNRRGPHQMRHTFASVLLQKGAPITYVSRQLGHKDPSITLRVYAHWLPDASRARLVDTLDDAAPEVTQTAPTGAARDQETAVSAGMTMVSQEGIEPSTRRLRVPSTKRKRAISE